VKFLATTIISLIFVVMIGVSIWFNRWMATKEEYRLLVAEDEDKPFIEEASSRRFIYRPTGNVYRCLQWERVEDEVRD